MEYGSANGELGHFQRRTDDGLDVANVDFACDVQSATGSAFDHIPLLIAWGWFHRENLIRVGVHGGAEKVKCEMPAGNKAVSIDAGEEACQVLIVDERGGLGVEVPPFQELHEFKHIAFGQVVLKCRWNELVGR